MSLPVSPDPATVESEVNGQPANTSPSRWPSNLAALWLALTVAVLCVAISAWWLFRARAPLGRDGWFLTPNPVAWYPSAWWLPLGSLLIFGGFAAISAYDAFWRAKTERAKHTSIRLSLAALMLLSPVWNWSLLGPGATPLANGAGNLIGVMWSDVATQYFGAAHEISDARTFSTEFAAKHQKPAAAALAHVATHPPGATLFYYGCRRVLETVPALAAVFQLLAERVTGESALTLAAQANEWRTLSARSGGVNNLSPLPVSAIGAALFVAVVIAAFAVATVPALYLLAVACGQSTLDRDAASRCGLAAATLWTLAPSVGLFAYTLDVLVACGAAWTLVLATKYFERAHNGWMIAAGVLWGLTCWLSFGALAVGAIVVLWTILQHGRAWPLAARDIAFLSAGFVAAWLLLLVLFPMQPILIFRQAMAAHHFATLESRQSGDWRWLNIFLFWMFCGWPVIALGIGRAILLVLHRDAVRGREKPDVSAALFCATVFVLFAMSLSGGVRGETERLWMPFSAPLCVFAAQSLLVSAPLSEVVASTAKLKVRARALEPLACSMTLLLLQALQALMMAAALAPLVRPI